MKHFLMEGQHLVPFAEIANLVDEHHAFLDKGYKEGVFSLLRPSSSSTRRIPGCTRGVSRRPYCVSGGRTLC